MGRANHDEMKGSLCSVPVAATRTALGSIEGMLDRIIVHKMPQFVVHHAITDHAVTCEFDVEKFMDKTNHALGKRVSVAGVLKKNSKGETIGILVENIRIISESSLVPTAAQRLAGA
jgi:hypothetical protein